MRRFLALIFLLAFTCQMLPVRAISKMLLKGQLTEEVKDNDVDDDDAGTPDEQYDRHFFYTIMHQQQVVAVKKVGKIIAISFNDALPRSFVGEIHCPPPNC